MDLAERYRRAAACLPTAAAAATSGSAVDGCWIDAEVFFFVTETELPGLGIIPFPFFARRDAATVEPAVSVDALIAALSALGVKADAAVLRGAAYDCPDRDRLRVGAGGVWLGIDLASGKVERLPDPRQDALASPCGRTEAVLQGFDLALRDTLSGETRQLTDDGEALRPYARPPQASLSSLANRHVKQPVGLWSPEGGWLLTHCIDEQHLPERVLVESTPPGKRAPTTHHFRYASARDPLPLCTLVAFQSSTGRRILFPTEEVTLFPPIMSRHAWFVGEDRICRIRSDRHQTRLELLVMDLVTGEERVVLEEVSQNGYLETHPVLGAPPNCRYLRDSEEVIWWSERSGWGHLHLHDARTGSELRQLTKGEWQVREIIEVDAAGRSILFTSHGLASRDDPILRSLARVCMDTGRVDVIVSGDLVEGDVGVVGGSIVLPPLKAGQMPVVYQRAVSPDRSAIAVRRSSIMGGTRTEIVDFAGQAPLRIVQRACSLPSERMMWLDVLSATGNERLKAALYVPHWHDGNAKLPILDLVYPGPQMGLLGRSEGGRVAAQAQALAELGLAVLVTESRGLPFRSRAFHLAGYGALLEPQMADHIAVIEQLRSRFGFLDPARAGILGSSAGGFAAAYAMFAYSGVYSAGIAICGPYDPADYLGGWMNKYVGPDIEGRWDAQDLTRLAGQLEGALLLIHGELDDNVHPSHTLRLAKELAAAGKRFEMLLVPGEGHMVQLTSPFAQQRIWDFLVQQLRDEPVQGLPMVAYGAEDLAVLSRVNGRDAPWS
jgi:pimeloyl-ACP methyl ester carboxylesterase